MTRFGKARTALAGILVLVLVAGLLVALRAFGAPAKTHVVAYFANSNGIFPGDEVRILGVPVGRIDSIEPQAERAKITFWINDKYSVPADVKAVILSPTLVTSRAIQLTPAYTAGPTLARDAVIPQQRTAVPVEWDDFRIQLRKLTETLQPTKPGGVSSLGAFIDTAADNLRGQGEYIHKTVIEVSQVLSALGDHSGDLFGTFNNLSLLVHALQDSSDLMRQLNRNLGWATGLLANDPDEIGQAVSAINDVSNDVRDFVAENRDTLGTTSDKLASVSQALVDSLDDIKQTLHVVPTAFQNFINIYEPAQGALTGALAINNFANPISFLCGAIQAASRLGAEQSAKLCVQYLAPIIKNRQYNFPPLGINPIVGASARPNEVTYSEDWMRPDYVPPQPPTPPAAGAPPAGVPPPSAEGQPDATAPLLPAEAVATNPANGLPGLMVPPGAGQ